MKRKQAILRFEKRKKGSVAKIGNHHERTKESYKSNPDIQREKSGLNYHIKRPQDTYTREMASRIAQAGRLNGQIEEIRQALADVNMLNATKKRKEVLSMLQKWYPLANGFNEQVKRIVSDSKVLKEQNAELVHKLKSEQGNFSQEISEKDKEITDLMTEYTDLISSYNDNIRLLQQLEPEEARILQKRLQGQQSRIQEPQDLEDYEEQY